MDIASDENLTSEQVLELFLTLFGHQTLPLAIRNSGQSNNINGHNNNNNHVNINSSNDENENNSNTRRSSSGGRDGTGNRATNHVEVVSNMSSPTPSDSMRDSKSAKANTTRDSLIEEMMFNPTIGTGTVGGSEGSAFNSPRSVKMDVTPTQPSSGSAQRHNHSTPASHTWTTTDSTPTSTPITDAHAPQGSGESHVRPPRHTHTPTPAQAHIPSSQHAPQGSNHLPSPTQGSNHLPSEVVECSTLARSTLGGSQSSTSASSKLQEALSKLRQVSCVH